MVLYCHLLLTSAIPRPKPGKKEDLYTPPSQDQNQDIPPPSYSETPRPPSHTTNSPLSGQPLANQGSYLERFFRNLRGSGLPVPEALDDQLTSTWLTRLNEEKYPLSVLQAQFTVSVRALPSPDAFNGKFQEPYISDTIKAMKGGSGRVSACEKNESSSTKERENAEREKWKYLWDGNFVKDLYPLVYYLKGVELVLGRQTSNDLRLKARALQAYFDKELPFLEETLPQAFLAREYLHKESAAKLPPDHLQREVLNLKDRCNFLAPDTHWVEVDRLYKLVGLTKLCIEKSHCTDPVNAVVKYLDGILENKSMPNGYWLKKYLQESCDYFKSHINRGRGH
ncbi:hypothetical protein H0H93_009437 [Arthromyces matolae]|nr:hypothetical protein H0H93_009437 [Arthromyces matolae]